VGNFSETFSIRYFSSLRQDLTVLSQKIKNKKIQFIQFTLNAVDLEYILLYYYSKNYFLKLSQGILGIKELIHDFCYLE
jgi:hypothetical protein